MISSRPIWEVLKDEQAYGAGYARRRVAELTYLEVFLALSQPDRRPCIIIDVDGRSVPHDTNNLSCKGFSFSTHWIQIENRKRVMMILELLDNQYEDVFISLTDDVLTALENVDSERMGVRWFISRVHRWREFFEKRGTDGLSEYEQQGLYGELWFMNSFLFDAINIERAVNSWRGPEGTNQDYQISTFAIEIKTTSSNPHEKIAISNILQLDCANLDALFLVHLALDSRKGADETLPNLVGTIRKKIIDMAPHVKSRFDSSLTKAGYLDAQVDKYQTIGYGVRHVNYYHVKEGFPRVREQDLANGVGDVQYSIAVSACQGYIVDPQNIKSRMSGG